MSFGGKRAHGESDSGGRYHYGSKRFDDDDGGFGRSSGGSSAGSKSGERDYGGGRSGGRDYGGGRSGYGGSGEKDYGGSRSGYGSREGDYGGKRSGERDSKSGGGDRDYGGSRTGYGSREGDFGGGRSGCSGRGDSTSRDRDDYSSRGSAGRGRGAYQGGYEDGYERREEPTVEETEQRIQAAHRRMEQSSGSALRTLHETLNMGIDTTEELERQAETMDRVETRLDQIEVDLDTSKRHMRNIKSVFGGVGNYFARKKDTSAITDPKISGAAKKSSGASASKSSAFPDKGPSGRGEQAQYQSTGNQVVDRNMDEMEKALHQLRGVGELIGDQLDDSDAQIDRVKWKMERSDVKIKALNKDIKRQL